MLRILLVHPQATSLPPSTDNEAIPASIMGLALQPIFCLETNVDDIRGEIMGGLFDRLLAQGALDVSILPSIGKKNRPAHLISVICHRDAISRLVEFLIDHTGTLGVRISQQMRVCLPRKIISVPFVYRGKSWEIACKVALDATGAIKAYKLEFDGLQALAEEMGVSPLNLERVIKAQLKVEDIQNQL